MLENIMQLIQNENTDEASKILNTLTKVCFMYIVFKSLLDRLPQGSKNMLKKKKEKKGENSRGGETMDPSDVPSEVPSLHFGPFIMLDSILKQLEKCIIFFSNSNTTGSLHAFHFMES